MSLSDQHDAQIVGADEYASPADDGVGLAWLAALVKGSPQAAVVWNEEGAVAYSNATARPIIEHAERMEGHQLRSAILTCLAENRHVGLRVSVPSGEGHLILDVSVIPAPTVEGRHVLLLARDDTLEHNFSNALVASRRLYKDLVACSSDFAWETKLDGSFSYVSPRGAIGYTAIELNGRLGRDLLYEEGIEVRANPFESHVELIDEEILLRHANGDVVVMRVSCVPVRESNGAWRGARGVCRDITEQKAQEEALERTRTRDRLVKRVADEIHNELTADAMLSAAAGALAEALEVPYCWILGEDQSGGLERLAQFGCPSDLDDRVQDIISDLVAETDERDWIERVQDGWHLCIVRCGHGETQKGYTAIARTKIAGDWTEEERALVASVANHIGVALAQAEAQDRLILLSRTDELTGLFNRRAFDDEVEIRLARVARTKSSGAMLYFDLDNFKAVNDERGHADGDAVLKAFSRMLKEGSRVTDLSARIGGDEFAVWLDDVNEEGAMTKARYVIEAFQELQCYSGRPDKQLNVSIGIAVAHPESDIDLKTLYAVSDAALYRAKWAGKGTAKIATIDDIETESGS